MSDIILDKVLKFATQKHAGQKRKFSGLDYITHPIAVSRAIDSCYMHEVFDDQMILMLKIIALLHDVVEDTNTSLKEIEDFLRSVGAENVESILLSIDVLTKKDGQGLWDYLTKIKEVFYALIVKVADLEHNMSDLREGDKLDKYRLSLYYLQN